MYGTTALLNASRQTLTMSTQLSLAVILFLTVECQRYFQYHTCIYHMNISGLVLFVRAGRASIRISNAYRDMINVLFLWLELIYHANLLHCS